MTTWTNDRWNDIVDLLTYVAVADKRTVADPDVRVWLDGAHDGRWPSIEVAYRAVRLHRSRCPGVWLEPGHVTQIVGEVEREARACYRRPAPTDEVLRLPLTEQDRWFQRQWQDHRGRFLAAWAAGSARPALGVTGGSSRQVAA